MEVAVEFISVDGTDRAETLGGVIWLLCCMTTGDTIDADSIAN